MLYFYKEPVGHVRCYVLYSLSSIKLIENDAFNEKHFHPISVIFSYTTLLD